MDPAAFAGLSYNIYCFVLNNPTAVTDPLGLMPNDLLYQDFTIQNTMTHKVIPSIHMTEWEWLMHAMVFATQNNMNTYLHSLYYLGDKNRIREYGWALYNSVQAAQVFYGPHPLTLQLIEHSLEPYPSGLYFGSRTELASSMYASQEFYSALAEFCASNQSSADISVVFTNGDLYRAVFHAELHCARLEYDGTTYVQAHFSDDFNFDLLPLTSPTILANNIAFYLQCAGAIRPYPWQTEPIVVPAPQAQNESGH
jgi:hypothetical protein